jgi:uncharacterized protein YehS (DUF1456 family)
LLNNDILRRIRYTFDMNDKTVMATFKEGGFEVTREQMSNWLKRDDDPQFQTCEDVEFAAFLNGFIIRKRGKIDDQIPEPESRLNNNIILRKLKIALNLKDIDLLELLNASQFPLSKHELSAFFRKFDHKNYKKCHDQVMRNFLRGMQDKFRSKPTADNQADKKASFDKKKNDKANAANDNSKPKDNRPRYSKPDPSKRTVYINPNATPKPPARPKLTLNKASKSKGIEAEVVSDDKPEQQKANPKSTQEKASDIWKASLKKSED